VLLELTQNFVTASNIPDGQSSNIDLLLDTYNFQYSNESNHWVIEKQDFLNIIDDLFASFEDSEIKYQIGENLQQLIVHQNQQAENFKELRNQARQYKDGRLDQLIPPTFSDHLDTLARPLRDHQIKAAQHLFLLKNGANFSVPGAGKTSVVLSVYEMLKKEGKVNCLFVVGPTACFYPWKDEFFKQLNRKPNFVILAGKTKEEREKYYYLPTERRPELYLISFQTFANDLLDLKRFFQNQENNIYFVVDEAHYIKKLGGTWSKAVLSIAPYATYRCTLTGTPMPHGYSDLYNIFDVLWGDISPLTSSGRIIINHLMQSGNLEESKERIDKAIGPLFYRVRKSELNLGPQNFHSPVMIRMNEKEKYLYESISRRIYQFSREDYLLEADTLDNLVKARIMRLRQVTSYSKLLDTAVPDYGENLWDEGSDIASTIMHYDELEKPAKLDKLIKLIKDFQSKNLKVVVWTNFIRTIQLIYSELLAHGIYSKFIYGGIPLMVNDDMDETEDREKIRKEFLEVNSGLDVLIANPAACSEAISLHTTCQNAIYYDLSFNCAQYLQSLDRIHRVGGSEDKEVEYYFLQYEDTIDQRILENLEDKKDRMYALIEKDYPIYNLDMFEDDDIEINIYKQTFSTS